MSLRTIYINIKGNLIEKIIGAVPTENNYTDADKLKLANMTGGELTTEQLNYIVSQVPPTDITGKVDKVTGSELLATTEAAKIHALNADNQSLSGLEVTTAKGTANGYCPLDASLKVPTANLPDTILGSVNYHGIFSAAGGINPIVSPLALQGDYFVISVGGTIGAVVYAVGDWIIYNGTTWERVDNSDKVSSVNGAQGAVVLNQDNIGDGTTYKQYSDTEKTKLAGIAASATVGADWNTNVSNKPTIPAAQVQADWNASSGMGQILNKPTVAAARLFANLAGPVVTSGTTEKVLLQLQIPANSAVIGSTYRAWIIGNSSSTGTLIFKVRCGAGGTITDTIDWTAVTSAAQVANARAGFDVLITIRSATTIKAEGVGYAGAVQLPTTIAAPTAPAIAISGVWYINLTVICSSGTFTAQVANIEEIK